MTTNDFPIYSAPNPDTSPLPVYEHDCDKCIFLGHYGGADLYFCLQQGYFDGSQHGSPTVLARFSSDPSNYTSGMAFAQTNVYLREAKRRASRWGLLV